MSDWKIGDRVQYDDFGSKFTAILTQKGFYEGGWRAVVDSIERAWGNCEGLEVGDGVSVVEGHSVKIEESGK